MTRPHEPNDSNSDEECLVAPPFTTIGLSIPSMSWLNQQLESDGEGPGMRRKTRFPARTTSGHRRCPQPG
ncbi:hypothetical protein BJX68DRAFT_248686 [Aspergillus pseudodeflectus]|uniref:Uncharacterized protein n=1 Tax=Aspergillus pseudodeflectus TaxID=176178 RepID=A0ABR4JF59_9EURO